MYNKYIHMYIVQYMNVHVHVHDMHTCTCAIETWVIYPLSPGLTYESNLTMADVSLPSPYILMTAVEQYRVNS